jgi:WD40 repeat protein
MNNQIRKHSSSAMKMMKGAFFVVGGLLLFACAFLQSPVDSKPNSSLTPNPDNTPSFHPAETETPRFVSVSNFQNFTPIQQWNAQNAIKITGIALSPDSNKVALLISRYKEQWWLQLRQSENGDLLWEANLGEKAAYNAVTFSPDGTLIATGLDHGNVKIWNAADGNLVQTLTGHVYAVRVVAFSPDGKWIASGASDNTARVWQVSNGMAKYPYKIKTDVRDIAWSPDSRYLAVTSNNIAVFDVVQGGDTVSVFYDTAGETKDLGEVAFSTNGIYLLGAGNWYNVNNGRWRYRILIWDFPFNTSSPLKIPIDDAIEDTVVSPDGQILLGVYKDKGKLLIIDIVRREIVGLLDIGPKLYMSYSPGISKFAVVSTETTVTIWGVEP